jgi:hypothetical protein
MGCTLNEIIAALPTERQERVEARYLLPKAEIERLHQPGPTNVTADVMHRERHTLSYPDVLPCRKIT